MAKKKESQKARKNGNNTPSRNNEELVSRLNRALSLEYAATIQYLNQHSLVRGFDRQDFAPFFVTSSAESHLHAQNLGNKIVSLGGSPTVTPAAVRQSSSLEDMLKDDLALEREALSAYIAAWEVAGENRPLRFWLENIIQEEQLHVDELEKLSSRRA
jgi:bacterioferritin